MPSSGMCCALYRGTFYAKDLSDPTGALLELGNAEATITQEMTEIVQANFQSLGGSACKVEYPESVNLEMTLHCTKPENLAIAFLGTASQLAGATVTNELHAVNSEEELIPFDHIPNKTAPIVVTGAGGTTPVYVAGTDYQVTNAGIKILAGSTIPVDGTNIAVDYVYGANWFIDAQVVGQKEFYVVLDGYNAGEDGDVPVVLKAFKVKFAPTESFSLITTEFASITLNGEILRDETKLTGSKFFTVEMGQATGVGY